MGLLDLLAQLLQIFTDLIPRFSTRPRRNEYMVVDHCLFGVFIAKYSIPYIPLIDHIEYYPKTEVPVDSDIQTLVTADGVCVTVNAAFTYQIIDPLVSRSRWGEEYYAANVAMVVRGVIEEIYSRHTWDEVLEIQHSSFIDACKSDLSSYGIELTYFCMEDRSVTRSIRHYGITVAQVTAG